MTRTCESCGHPLPDDSVLSVLSPLQQRIFLAIKRAGRSGIPGTEVMNAVYANVRNGGAVSLNIIAVSVRKINPKLEPFGLFLKGRRGAGGYYTLEKL